MTTLQTNPPFTVGDLIRKARLVAGMNQTELASQLGISRPLLSRWENSVGYPDVLQMRVIAEVTAADWLLDLGSYPSGCCETSAGQGTLFSPAAAA